MPLNGSIGAVQSCQEETGNAVATGSGHSLSRGGLSTSKAIGARVERVGIGAIQLIAEVEAEGKAVSALDPRDGVVKALSRYRDCHRYCRG